MVVRELLNCETLRQFTNQALEQNSSKGCGNGLGNGLGNDEIKNRKRQGIIWVSGIAFISEEICRFDMKKKASLTVKLQDSKEWSWKKNALLFGTQCMHTPQMPFPS